MTYIGGGAFSGCTSLTSVTIPEGVTSIGDFAFQYCNSLESITIPDSVTSIGESVFGSCTALTSITIGNNITYFGGYAFENTGYYNNEENWENNALYLGSYLINTKTSISGEYSIKEGTTAIADCAFYNCASLTSVIIPDNVIYVGNLVFTYCTSLTNITISDSITSIGYSTFYYCTSLTNIYYGGTANEWNSISIGGYDNQLSEVTIYYYSANEPDYKDGYNYWRYVDGEIVVWTEE